MADDDDRALELVRSELAERLRRQADEGKILDNKAQALLAFSVTALTFVLTAAPMPLVARVVSALAFLPTLVFAWATLNLYAHRDPIDTHALTHRHLVKGHRGLLIETVRAYRDAIDHNDGVHRDRAKKWKAALSCLAVAVTVGVLGIASEGLSIG